MYIVSGGRAASTWAMLFQATMRCEGRSARGGEESMKDEAPLCHRFPSAYQMQVVIL